MKATATATIQEHNQRPAAVWSAGGRHYDEISRGIADAIEHCVLRLNPRPGERILDLSTGTGWTSRVVARRGATVTGVDIAGDLLEAARAKADAEGLPIDYRARRRREPAVRRRRVRRRGVDLRRDVREPARGRRRGARARVPHGRPHRAHHLALRRQPVQDVRGDEALHAAADPTPGAALAVRMGPHRAHRRAARARLPRCGSRSGVSLLPRAERRSGVGNLLDRLRAHRSRWPPASIAERREAFRADFIAFHDGFPTELGICVPREYWLTTGVRG